MEDNKKDRKWRWEMQDNDDDDFMDIDISEIKEEAGAHTEDAAADIPSIELSETTEVEEHEKAVKAGDRLQNYVKLSAERAEKKKNKKESRSEEPEEGAKGFHIPVNEGSRSSKEERQKSALQNKGGNDKKHFKTSRLAPVLTIVVIIALAFLAIKMIGGGFTGPSWKEVKTDSEIYQLASKYYDARRDGNAELMQSILDPSASVNTAELARDAKIYEKFEDIKAYSYEGLDKGEYVLCFTCQYKIYDISTMVPSLSWLYAKPDAEGSLKLLTQKDMENNKDILNYAVSAANDSKFYGNIVEPVQNKYETAIKGDGNLKNFLVAMGSTEEGQVPVLSTEPDLRLPESTTKPEETEAVSVAATEAPTEPATEAPTEPATEAPTEPATEAPTEPATEAPTEPATEAPTTTASDEEDEFTKMDKNMYVSVRSVNCRKAPTTESAVIDGFLRGDKVHVIGTNGTWYKIELEDGVGYIRGDLLSESN